MALATDWLEAASAAPVRVPAQWLGRSPASETPAQRVANAASKIQDRFDGGVLAFSGEGWYPVWHESELGHDPDRIVVPVRDAGYLPAEIQALIGERDELVEWAQSRRSAAPKRDRCSGWRRGTPRCGSCGGFLAAPQADCACGFRNDGSGFAGR